MQLPQKLPLDLMQTKWSGVLNPLIENPTNQSSHIKGVVLISGVNVINHGLGQMQQGWIITDIDGAAVIYRSAAFNNLTLTLTSNAAVTINLEVF